MMEKIAPNNEMFTSSALESLRKKLLDLSSRNRLLNYKHTQGRNIRITNIIPDQIVKTLRDGFELQFGPVPEPSEKQLIEAGYIEYDSETGEESKRNRPRPEEWAKYLGLSTEYELTYSNSTDQSSVQNQEQKLPTLLYIATLEAQLSKINNLARSAIEESGSNVLYLNLGFLEWYESLDSNNARMAPLFTLPVQLQRLKKPNIKGSYAYTLSLKDDSLLTNLTLSEKLNHDFGLELPILDDDTLPESYFQTIEKRITVRDPRWKVKRQASLILLVFSKQVMFNDLNPDNWLGDFSFQKNPIISQLLGLSNNTNPKNIWSYQSEHNIDNIPAIYDDFPIVFDADSSQHSALIDAVKGENLVIEGPPGTGKSQTIANIIAACISNRKSVLFVAEKMAALNVVKARLDSVGLGLFCLELHSHRTNKQKLIRDLEASINLRETYREPIDIESDIKLYEEYKRKLNSYAKLINSKYKETGLTFNEILNKSTRYRQELNISTEDIKISNYDGDKLTQYRQKELFNKIDMLCEMFKEVASQAPSNKIENHYWYGVNNTKLSSEQIKNLSKYLTEWNTALTNLKEEWLNTCNQLEIKENPTTTKLEDICNLINEAVYLPNLSGNEPLQLISIISSEICQFQEYLDLYKKIHDQHDILKSTIKPDSILNTSALNTLQKNLNTIAELGIQQYITIEQLYSINNEIKETLKQLKFIDGAFSEVLPHIPNNLRSYFSNTYPNLKELFTFSKLLLSLPKNLWQDRDTLFDNPAIDSLLEYMEDAFNTLNPLRMELSQNFKLQQLPDSQTLKKHYNILKNDNIFRIFSTEIRSSNKAITELCTSDKPNKKQLLSKLPKLIQYAEGCEELNQRNQETPLLKHFFKGIDTPLKNIQQLRLWYKNIRSEYGMTFGDRVIIGTTLLNLEYNLAFSLYDYIQSYLFQPLESIIDAIAKYRTVFHEYLPLNTNNHLIAPIANLNKLISYSLMELENHIINSSNSFSQISTAIVDIERQQKTVSRWLTMPIHNTLIEQDFCLSAAPSRISEEKLSIADSLLKIARIANKHSYLLNSILIKPDIERYNTIQTVIKQLIPYKDQHLKSLKYFTELGEINTEDWLAPTNHFLISIIERNNSALNNPSWLQTWLDYINQRIKLRDEGLSNIVNQLENHNLSTHLLNKVIKLAIYNCLSQEIINEHPDLSQFSGIEHSAIRKKFQEYDLKLLTLQRELVAYKTTKNNLPLGNAHGKVSDLTELSLIRHTFNLKKQRIAIRDLLDRASGALQALNPCFMMSPMSVAQYLKPNQFNFDIVIMDEASQIRPEDALGAIARGKSLVVVGDPKQLPPTSFFQKITDDNENDDTTIVESSESILETFMPIFKCRRLRWHYRSQHESLIAFSNQQFYDSNLVLFPSPLRDSPNLGIRFNRVLGCFIERRNIEEAKQIIDYLIEQLRNNPKESVGIVAMNSEQSDELEHQLELRLRQDSIALQSYEDNQKLNEPLFIKNLENVQGDERDVIIISMTYGPEIAGSKVMYQRFGPINSDIGWRRLNVLFTRAKKRMHIYSSMESGHILISDNKSRGIQSLKNFLLYCEKGHLHTPQLTGSEPDSDFEIAVRDALAKLGYECEAQLGVSGYRLDLAVKDPIMPGRFLLGIECDGATYHSAKSARDRDHLRQEILENLGWHIHRIWSTDWFKNPDAEIQRVLNQLEKLRATAK